MEAEEARRSGELVRHAAIDGGVSEDGAKGVIEFRR